MINLIAYCNRIGLEFRCVIHPDRTGYLKFGEGDWTYRVKLNPNRDLESQALKALQVLQVKEGNNGLQIRSHQN